MGKKTERLKLPGQLRTDEAMAREIRVSAEEDCRDLEDQLRWLLILGMRLRQLVSPASQFVVSSVNSCHLSVKSADQAGAR